MAHLIWIDPNLLTNEKESIRNSTFSNVLMKCGWNNGSIMAEIPRLSTIKRMAYNKIADGLSSARLDAVINHIKSKKLSIRIPNSVGENDEERAINTSLIEFLLFESQDQTGKDSRYREIRDYFCNVPEFATVNNWDNLDFVRRIDLLVIGSERLDIIDQYQPIDRLNPLLRHLLAVFGARGPHNRYLVSRSSIWLHIANLHPALSDPNETVASILSRMGAGQLMDTFDITIAVWKKNENHSRFILGDIGGLMLGESLNSSGSINVSSISDWMTIRKGLDHKIYTQNGIIRIIK